MRKLVLLSTLVGCGGNPDPTPPQTMTLGFSVADFGLDGWDYLAGAEVCVKEPRDVRSCTITGADGRVDAELIPGERAVISATHPDVQDGLLFLMPGEVDHEIYDVPWPLLQNSMRDALMQLSGSEPMDGTGHVIIGLWNAHTPDEDHQVVGVTASLPGATPTYFNDAYVPDDTLTASGGGPIAYFGVEPGTWQIRLDHPSIDCLPDQVRDSEYAWQVGPGEFEIEVEPGRASYIYAVCPEAPLPAP